MAHASQLPAMQWTTFPFFVGSMKIFFFLVLHCVLFKLQPLLSFRALFTNDEYVIRIRKIVCIFVSFFCVWVFFFSNYVFTITTTKFCRANDECVERIKVEFIRWTITNKCVSLFDRHNEIGKVPSFYFNIL